MKSVSPPLGRHDSEPNPCGIPITSVARFNQGEGQEENAIVTSTGKYVIAWDFKKVKKGQLDKYEIKKYEDNVVQDNFKFGDDKEIVSEPTLPTRFAF